MCRSSLVICLTLFLLTTVAKLSAQEVPPSDDAVQDSLKSSSRDRDIRSSGFKDFKAATTVPAISPALPQATLNDLVARYSDLIEPQSVVAVVLKPRLAGSVH